jgi:hypothetical protein
MKADLGAKVALRAAETALDTLRRDLEVSGVRRRQRYLIRRINEALETVKWHIDDSARREKRLARSTRATSENGAALLARQPVISSKGKDIVSTIMELRGR